MFFDDRRNRTLLLVFLLASGTLECMFFAYAAEGMFSPVYYALMDLLILMGTAALCSFMDLRRRGGVVFITLGALLMGLFATLSAEWFLVDFTEWYMVLGSGSFLRHLARYCLPSLIPVYLIGLLRRGAGQESADRSIPAALALAGGLIPLAFGEPLAYCAALAMCGFMTGWFLSRLDGGGMNLKSFWPVLLAAGYIAVCAALYRLEGGRLLIEEASLAVALLVVGAGLVASLCHKRFGLYVYTFSGLQLAAAYLLAYLRGDTGTQFFVGILPLLVLFFVGFAADSVGAEQAHLRGGKGGKSTGKKR